MQVCMSKTLAFSPFVETDITYNETKEYHYLFNATASDTLTMRMDGGVSHENNKTNKRSICSLF